VVAGLRGVLDCGVLDVGRCGESCGVSFNVQNRKDRGSSPTTPSHPNPAPRTTAPALAATGPSFFEMEPPAENSAMSTSPKLSSVSSSMV